MANWHYEQNGQAAGPVSDDELHRLVAVGTVSPTTRIWAEGMGDWQQAGMALPALFGAVASPTYAPRSSSMIGYGYAGSEHYQTPGLFSMQGRIRRTTYGLRILAFMGVFMFVAMFLAVLLGVLSGGDEDMIGGIVMLALFPLGLLTIPTSVQRLHDLNQSGWVYLVGLVPLVGWLLGIYMLFFEGTPGPNQYGPDPKGRG